MLNIIHISQVIYTKITGLCLSRWKIGFNAIAPSLSLKTLIPVGLGIHW